jgi:hypothetical protein
VSLVTLDSTRKTNWGEDAPVCSLSGKKMLTTSDDSSQPTEINMQT